MTALSLGGALEALEKAARDAGVDPAVARREGESLAATVAEPAKGAFLDWSEETGGASPSWALDAMAAFPTTRGFSSPSEIADIATSASALAYAGACCDFASDSAAMVGVGAAR